ncbi:MAG: helix-turn-helix domain-containing protein [Clostridiaceae bacterium]|nr:helix-turn-helix domain-containing protein [Clostridiaceae bacterium]
MDCVKIGKLIARLRKEKKLTQKNLADALGVKNKTVSKWECGLGCPDLSLWPQLSEILGVDMQQMMEGEITQNKPDAGNIEKVLFYACPICGNVLVSTGSASIYCCGRKLEPLSPVKLPEMSVTVEEIDTDYYVTFDHPMTKEHYLSFAAYVKSDKVYLNRLYPDQNPSCRFPVNRGGKIYVYCIKHGLMVYSMNRLTKTVNP